MLVIQEKVGVVKSMGVVKKEIPRRGLRRGKKWGYNRDSQRNEKR